MLGAAVLVGVLESLVARLRMLLVPQFAMLIAVVGVIALVLAATQTELG